MHAGYSHLLGNVLLQLLFGLPIEMVHGPVRVAVIYEAGVAAGALACATLDPYSSVIGASGGVYALYGVHVANLVLNFAEMRRGPCNRWVRLLCLLAFNGLELFYYLAFPSETTSYAAHLGGWCGGLALGMLVLHDVKVHRYERYVRLAFACLFVVAFVGALGWHFTHFPPRYLSRRVSSVDAAPCCWHAIECARRDDGGGFARDDFSLFRCVAHHGAPALASADGRTPFESCGQYAAYANATRAVA